MASIISPTAASARATSGHARSWSCRAAGTCRLSRSPPTSGRARRRRPSTAPLVNLIGAALGITLRPWQEALQEYFAGDRAVSPTEILRQRAPLASVVIPNWNGAGPSAGLPGGPAGADLPQPRGHPGRQRLDRRLAGSGGRRVPGGAPAGTRPQPGPDRRQQPGFRAAQGRDAHLAQQRHRGRARLRRGAGCSPAGSPRGRHGRGQDAAL